MPDKNRRVIVDDERLEKRNARIVAHYRSLSNHGCCNKHPICMAKDVWMPMARRWKIPIRELKAIIWGVTP